MAGGQQWSIGPRRPSFISRRFNGSLNLDPILQLIYKSVLCQQTIVVLRRICLHKILRSSDDHEAPFVVLLQIMYLVVSVFVSVTASCWCELHGGTHQGRDHLTNCLLAAHVFRVRLKLYIRDIPKTSIYKSQNTFTDHEISGTKKWIALETDTQLSTRS